MSTSEGSAMKSKNFHLDLGQNMMRLEDIDSPSIQSSLKSLQSQIDLIEEKASYANSSSRRYKTKSNIDSFLKDIDQAEKEIGKIESSIRKSPAPKTRPNSNRILDELQAKLIQERQSNYLLKQENEKLRKKIQFKKNYTEDLNLLQEDYHNLVDSFRRSENIRNKQKQLVLSLKAELFSLTDLPNKKAMKNKRPLNKYRS
ncbi:hypothetical protein SteCoe_23515 [Stentor coeruleus]|uniref:Uncharacterized protein n=1 Tax=Stentor coeruleus TaxID=5963 RepID=A0A1R2BJR0_9CILI|nr:hypothetical protein SteCoe_23515 [Stentor coeruleus]